MHSDSKHNILNQQTVPYI